FFSSRRRHTRSKRDWSSDVCSSDLLLTAITRGFLLAILAARQITYRPFNSYPISVYGLITLIAANIASHLDRRSRGPRLKPDTRSEERRVGKEGRTW